MFTQFFGNYLLNKHIVTSKQLIQALEVKNETRVKLGVLAMNAGLMTSEDVERVHTRQMSEDKRFGDLAVQMGFLTEMQVGELLSSQKVGHLLLGQALVDSGFLTNAQFESALNSYKALYSLDDEDFIAEQGDKVLRVISDFYGFNKSPRRKYLTEYVSLYFSNLRRFIGDDFTPISVEYSSMFKCGTTASQSLSGVFSFTSIMEGGDCFKGFAKRFSNENIEENGEFAQACVSEFLNLHNGLYAVNISNRYDIELALSPQEVRENSSIPVDGGMYFVPVSYPFGTMTLIISE